MPGTLNLYLCMFLLCVTGAVSGPLRRARIHPAVAGIFCLFTMFFSVFEEVQLLPRLYVSPGGFFMPLAGGILLLAQGPQGKRRYVGAYIVLTMLIGFLMGQLTESLTDVWFHGAPWIVFCACIVSALLFCGEHHTELTCAILGYYGAGLLGYLLGVLPQAWGSMTLGSGQDALPCALVVPVTLALCEVIRLCSGLLRRRREKGQRQAPARLEEASIPTEPEHQSA